MASLSDKVLSFYTGTVASSLLAPRDSQSITEQHTHNIHLTGSNKQKS